LLFKEIRSGCEEFLKNQLDPQNCLGIKLFADLHNCINLKSATQEYIYEHFTQIVQNSDEFYSLKPKELEDLIKSNEIEVANEECVYNCVFNWINFDKKNREQYLSKLLSHVRLPLLSPQFLTDVCDKEVMIKHSFECRDMIDEAKKFYLRPDCRAEMNGIRFKIRTGKDEHLVMLGGKTVLLNKIEFKIFLNMMAFVKLKDLDFIKSHLISSKNIVQEPICGQHCQ